MLKFTILFYECELLFSIRKHLPMLLPSITEKKMLFFIRDIF